MNLPRHAKRPGLILLVVLGMLALFSMLAITYVVFASQSRATSVALARKDIRGNKDRKPLFEEAIKQLVRGSTDNASATYGHSLLGDLYGDRESSLSVPATPATRAATLLNIRNYSFDRSSFPPTTVPMTYDSPQRPMLLAPDYSTGSIYNGHFLRIPLDPGNYGNPNPSTFLAPPNLPMEHDVLNGRVVTFPEGNGPLSGQSFHIVRYIGRIDPDPANSSPIEFAQNYSIIIDLSEVDLSLNYSSYDAGTNLVTTLSLAEWVNAYPPPVTPAKPWQSSVYACYEGVDTTAAHRLTGGYQLLVNATPLNSHGVGVLNDGSSQTHTLDTSAGSPLPPIINNVASGLQPNLRFLETQGGLSGPGGILGDSDEPYDAPDYANFFLSHRETGATATNQIIPSFHRAALINYIVNWKDPATYQPLEFLATVRRIEAACGRPLSINVITPAGVYTTHPNFDGSNAGAAMKTPQLIVNVPSNWATDWPSTGLPAFNQWVNWLVTGPWDVDNDADGLPDSMWVDVGLPLQTSADGELLKAMVAYYVEDLDNKLDVNATSSYAQANAKPTPYPPAINYTAPVDGNFARYTVGNTTFLSQGMGYGPAETSFRHLLSRQFLPVSPPPTPPQISELVAFQRVLQSRYGRNSTTLDQSPGVVGDDAISQLRMREQRNVFAHATLPGLPLGTHGRATVGLDRLGNPRIMNVDNVFGQSMEDPYEARWLSRAYSDSPFTIAEWERIYRIGDGDRTALPQRLEDLFGESPNTISTSNLRHEITPRSSYLRVPILATRGQASSTLTSSFLELVNTVRKLRNPTAADITMLDGVNHRGFASLFPLEFQRGHPLNLNRPLGNGVDDDGDGQIDEPQELFASTEAAYHVANPTSTAATSVVASSADYLQGQPTLVPPPPAPETPGSLRPFDPNVVYSATPPIYRNNLETRQLLARHLYCLAQLIIPQDYQFPNISRSVYSPAAAPTALTPEEKQIRARILAQWAVNIVDFRDLDSAMTRFAYDVDPLAAKTDSSTSPATQYFAWEPTVETVGTITRPLVVWGMEQPELLITESLATHDLRIKRETTASPPRYDQYRVPQGSLFLEFFCPRTTQTNTNQNSAGVSPALYGTYGADVQLDLTRLAPAGPGVGAAPVFRVYISNPQPDTTQTPLALYNDPSKKHLLTYQMPVSNHRFDATGGLVPGADTNALNSGFVFDRSTPATAQIPEPDTAEARVLVFASGFTPDATNSPGVEDPAAQVFVSQTGGVHLSGGQYLVVGPRAKTFFGSRTSAFSDPTDPENHPSNHRIELSPGWAQMVKTDQTSVAQRATMRNCFTMLAASAAPPAWSDPKLPTGIGLNVSEPLADANYYKAPTTVVNPGDTATDTGPGGFGEPGFGTAAYTYWDAYNDYSVGPPLAAEPPFDDGASGPLQYWQGDGATAGQNMTTNAVNVGTQENWCTAYLQRLADPEKPWDATFNPYITVDWIPIDLTVFSGEENHPDVYPAPAPAGQEIKFASRQKTGQSLVRMPSGELQYDDRLNPAAPAAPTVLSGTTFYSTATPAPVESTPIGSAADPDTETFFDYEIAMDEVAGTAAAPIRPTLVDLRPSTDASHVNETFCTLGFLNSTYRIAGEEGAVATSGLVGIPGDPTLLGLPGAVNPDPNWLPDSLYWTNRQFVNAYELANVPLSSPGQFMQEFCALDNTSGGSRYASISSANTFAPFGHLLSFQREQKQTAMPMTSPGEVPMAALFELVETQSPWSDAYEVEDPRAVAFKDPALAPGGMGPVVASTNAALSSLRAPYNRVSRFVEPGRVNLNTVAEPNVIQGLWYNSLSPADRATTGPASVNAVWTAMFGSRRGYVPNAIATNFDATRLHTDFPTQFARIFKPGMEAGMIPATRPPNALLSAELTSNLDAPANVTLMREDPTTAGQPLLRDVNSFAQKNALTDTYPITRLANLTSGRSNVFAVYVTIGLFQYDEGTASILQEYGADKGESKRYKAFYVIDRSIPVGFQTGVDHNAEKTILIRRYLKTDDK